MMFSCSKYRSSFISRSVRKQNIECSNGVIFLMATLCPDGLCNAELSMASATTMTIHTLTRFTRQHHMLPLLRSPVSHTVPTH